MEVGRDGQPILWLVDVVAPTLTGAVLRTDAGRLTQFGGDSCPSCGCRSETLLEHDGGWLLICFDGARYGGRLVGYGSHGDVVIAAARTG